MFTFRTKLLASAALMAVAIMPLGAASAWAQAEPAAKPDEKVVVTGSRIPRSGFNTSTPLSIVTGEDIRKTGYSTVADLIQNMPAIQPQNQFQSSPSSIIATVGASANLRGLGSDRTLVLVNGRRHVPGDTTGGTSVDLNMISPAFVKRVEVITGGTSAVYGSDAIAGVLNFILRDDLEGAEFDVQTGISEYGDAWEYKGSAVVGGKFNQDKGYIIAGVEYASIDSLSGGDRDELFPGIQRKTGPAVQPIIPRSKSQLSRNGTFRFLGAPLGGVPGTGNGNVNSFYINDQRQFTAITDPNCRVNQTTAAGVNAGLCQEPGFLNSLIYSNYQGELNYWNARAYATYEIAPRTEFFAEFSYNSSFSTSGGNQPNFATDGVGNSYNARVRHDNFYINDPVNPVALSMRAAFNASGINGSLGPCATATSNASCSTGISWFLDVIGPRVADQYRDTTRGVLGLKGDFDFFERDVSWEAYYQFGHLASKTVSNNLLYSQRMVAALDVVDGPAPGRDAICRDNPGFDETGCVPWDIVNGPSQAAINYVKATGIFTSDIEQQVGGVNFTTELFEMWAGPVDVAFGGEFRIEEADFLPDPAIQAGGILTINQIPQTKGKTSVVEGYVEAVVPILADAPFFKKLNLEGAMRVADYNRTGVVQSYRYGFEYLPFDDIRFRGNISTSSRAPNIGDLFAPQSENFTNLVTDPCGAGNYAAASAAQKAARDVSCAFFIAGWTPAYNPSSSSIRLRQGGNTALKEETAEGKQIGVVLRPSFIDGLQFSVDYWEISLTDRIASITAADTLRLCYDSTTPPAANALCALTVRSTDLTLVSVPGSIYFLSQQQQNIATTDTKGIDLALSHVFDLGSYLGSEEGSLGNVVLRANATYLDKFTTVALPGSTPSEFAGFNPAQANWQGNSSINWSNGELSVSWNSVYIGSTLLGSKPGYVQGSRTDDETGLYHRHDLAVLYDLTSELQLRGGVINILDQYPPAIPELFEGNATGTGQYDNRGRFFYVGASYAVN